MLNGIDAGLDFDWNRINPHLVTRNLVSILTRLRSSLMRLSRRISSFSGFDFLIALNELRALT